MRSVISIIARDDTLFGACHAFGEDFGFSPLYPRILFALLLFWSPAAALGAYAALWALIAVTRIAVPGPAPAAETPAAEPAEPPAKRAGEDLPLAA